MVRVGLLAGDGYGPLNSTHLAQRRGLSLTEANFAAKVFILEGLPALICGAITFFFLPECK